MKKYFLGFILILLAQPVLAAGHFCTVQKSLLWVDQNGKLQNRKAETEPFPIVNKEHETPYVLALTEKSGATWGEVKIATGTLLGTPEGDVMHAEAIVENPDRSTAARIATVFDKKTTFTRAMTILEIADTDFDPNLTLNCRLIP